MGQVIGATNRLANIRASARLIRTTLLATSFATWASITEKFPDPQGRPIPLARGTPLQDVI